MKITREKAIELHRTLWYRIALKNKNGECVNKKDVIDEMKKDEIDDLEGYPMNMCYLCEYVINNICGYCPLKWEGIRNNCMDRFNEKDGMGLYSLWNNAEKGNNLKMASKFARQIAELPEKKL